MPSPFPGMDPWLERPAVFPDVHNSLIYLLRVALNAVLPPQYAATIDNRVYVDPELRRVPDVALVGPDDGSAGGTAAAAATLTRAGLLEAATEPVPEPVEEPYLEIVTGDDERLVTAIEVVSPANKKPGEDGRASYKQKQGEYRASGVNLVEIDLLRGGRHTTAVPEARLRAVAGPCDYHVSVMLAGGPLRYFVAPILLADRLPAVSVPLDANVTPVTIELQPLFDQMYDGGRFAMRAKYGRRDPDPPLTPDQRAWADAVLRAKGALPPGGPT